jgi:ABC-type spermidine/putrescine transport system permease subunit I
MPLPLTLPALYDRLTGPWGRKAVIGVPLVFLLVFFLLPFLVVMKISVSTICDKAAATKPRTARNLPDVPFSRANNQTFNETDTP